MNHDWPSPNLWHQTAAIWPVAVPTSLNWYDIGAILHIIQAARVGVIVEIGVDQGGLSALLIAYTGYAAGRADYPSLRYLGIDITLDTVDHTLLRRHPELFVQADAFAPETIHMVQSVIAHTPRALLFCDGGDKPQELRTYSAILRPGDLILAHDYHNEYGDEALIGLPATLERLTPVWLDRTLLCLFEKR